MKKIIYIHGFASNGESDKAKHLKEYFGCDNVFSPTLPPEPKLAIELLEELIVSLENNVFLIGTSLGGFYCWYLCESLNVFGIQINPLIDVAKFSDKIGHHKNLSDGVEFEILPKYVDQLIDYKNSITEINYDYLTLFLGMNDEVLNPTIAEHDVIYQHSQKYKFQDNHRFESFKDQLGLIADIINKH